MSWLSDLAGKAESLLNNLDEQTGAVLRNGSGLRPKKGERGEFDPGVWNQRKKPVGPRSMARKTPLDNKNNALPPRRAGVTPSQMNTQSRTKTLINRNNPSKSAVGDAKIDRYSGHYGYTPRKRYNSTPSELDPASTEDISLQMQNMEVENAMLKNELNVTNREIQELLERLRKTEDALVKTNTKLETAEVMNLKLTGQKETLFVQLEQVKNQVNNLTNVDLAKCRDQKHELETEVTKLRDRNKDLEELARLLDEKSKERDSAYTKAENDLRHAQSTINMLQSDLQKNSEECKRLEREWDVYKHRVKSMLSAKDKEIKSLKAGIHFTEDTKVLIDQIEKLKHERDILSEAVTRVRCESQDMKQYLENLESRHNNAERIVVALRDALKDERSARTRAEASCNALSKELKTLQIETGQTIASLRNALRDKDQELRHLRGSSTSQSTSINNSAPSALNVADYDVGADVYRECPDSDAEKKVYQLSQKLVQRQGKIDTLVAQNCAMKIQMEKMESKLKNELEPEKAPASVVQITQPQSLSHNVRSERHVSPRRHHSTIASVGSRGALTAWKRVGVKIGLIMRRFPLLRVFFIFYMMGLHFFVVTILLANTPDTKQYYTNYYKETYPLQGVFE